MKNPTLRKVLKRGFVPCRYHDSNEFRHGWIIERAVTRIKVQLVGEERPRWLSGHETKFVVAL